MSLEKLAELLRHRNSLDAEIATLIGRPALTGHIGEYVASLVFDIELESSATRRGIDGRFRSGPLAGRTVNVKFYPKLESLDMRSEYRPDYYLVLAGPRSPACSSRGASRPLCIDGAYLFEADPLIRELTGGARPVKICEATSIRRERWEKARIYPATAESGLPLTQEQANRLHLFVLNA
jgi:hypothetical protein